MRYIVIGLIVLSFLIGMAGAVEGYQHKDFVNAEGAHIRYDINESGYFINGYFQEGSLIFYFSGSNGTVTIYTTDQGFKGIMHVKPYDGTVFDVDLIHLDNREAGVFASYRFDGNWDYTGNPE